MIETTDINNAAERRDIITKYGMLEQAYSEITFCWQETSEKEYPWQQDHLAGEQELLLELININMERPVQEAPDTKERLRLGRYRRWYGIRNKRRAAGEVRCEKGDKSRRPVHRNIMLSGSFYAGRMCAGFWLRKKYRDFQICLIRRERFHDRKSLLRVNPAGYTG